jgi:hypothetical protein
LPLTAKGIDYMISKKISHSSEPRDLALLLYDCNIPLDKSAKGIYLSKNAEVAKQFFLLFPVKGLEIDEYLL